MNKKNEQILAKHTFPNDDLILENSNNTLTESDKIFLNNLLHESEFRENKTRQKQVPTFIKKIVQFCTAFEFDYEIIRQKRGIVAYIKTPILVLFGEGKMMFEDMISFSDEFSFEFEEEFFLIRLDYYTHDIYLNGQKRNFT